MDGYDVNNPYVYSDQSTQVDFSFVAELRNSLIKKELANIKKSIEIDFITPSLYNNSF